MTLADLSIKRPTFITSIIVLMIAAGLVAIRGLGVDLFPNITFPVVTVTTPYPGAGPSALMTVNFASGSLSPTLIAMRALPLGFSILAAGRC